MAMTNDEGCCETPTPAAIVAGTVTAAGMDNDEEKKKKKDADDNNELPVVVDLVERGAIDKWQQRKRTLYDEVLSALHGAFLMFCLPDLKALAAQEGVLKGDPEMIRRIVEMPVTFYDVLTIYEQNKTLLTDERLKCEDRADMYHAVLGLARFEEIESKEEKEALLKNVLLITLDDVKGEEECVYAIGLNKVDKFVTIAFRGSVTSKDFQQDAKALLSYTQNPIQADDSEGLSEEVGLHLGFKEYLYGSSTEQKNDPNKQPKYKVILDIAARLIQENPGFHLRIVGHSLGGALTTVLALEAAGDDRFPTPITAVTSGAPKVGNLAFLHTYEYLERTGRLRCIQVANNKDPVAQSPPIGNFDPCGPIFCPWRIFRHVGLRLHLVPRGFIIWHPLRAKSYPGILVYDWIYVATNCSILLCGCLMFLLCCNVFVVLSIPFCCCCTYRFLKKSRGHHTQLKYIHRLEYNKDALEKLSLDELNAERFGRSPYHLSRILVRHRGSTMLDPDLSDSVVTPASLLPTNNNQGTTGDNDDDAQTAEKTDNSAKQN